MCCIILIDDFQGFEGVHRCCLDETLHTIIDRLTDAGVSESKTCLIYFTRKIISCCGNRSNASLKSSLCRFVLRVVKFKMKGNRQLLSSKNSYFQDKTKCKLFLLKISFICMGIEIYFHINGFVLSLALKLRLEATWIWPIVMHSTNCSYVCRLG